MAISARNRDPLPCCTTLQPYDSMKDHSALPVVRQLHLSGVFALFTGLAFSVSRRIGDFRRQSVPNTVECEEELAFKVVQQPESRERAFLQHQSGRSQVHVQRWSRCRVHAQPSLLQVRTLKGSCHQPLVQIAAFRLFLAQHICHPSIQVAISLRNQVRLFHHLSNHLHASRISCS